jgi:hypothetical protein
MVEIIEFPNGAKVNEVDESITHVAFILIITYMDVYIEVNGEVEEVIGLVEVTIYHF